MSRRNNRRNNKNSLSRANWINVPGLNKDFYCVVELSNYQTQVMISVVSDNEAGHLRASFEVVQVFSAHGEVE